MLTISSPRARVWSTIRSSINDRLQQARQLYAAPVCRNEIVYALGVFISSENVLREQILGIMRHE